MNIADYAKLIRFDKPAGTLLLFWPVAWALYLLNADLKLVLIFATGVFLMRSAGCIINDLADYKLDKHVARTQSRPLAAGHIKPKQALVFLFVLLALAASLLLFLNPLCFYIALAAVVLSCLYPYCKRITYFPQLVLGITFNLGVLMVYAATLNVIPMQAIMLYLATIFWTLGYDTLYALSDREDDIKVGIKSTAVKFGDTVMYWLIGFYIIFYLLLWLATEQWLMLITIPYAVFLLYQKSFQQNALLGALIFLSLLI